MESFKPSKNPRATPEEIAGALRAADIAAREKEATRKKAEAESGETARLTRLMLEEQARTAEPYKIGEKEIAEAEKVSGQNFREFN